MSKKTEELLKDIDYHFDTIGKEEVEADLKECGWGQIDSSKESGWVMKEPRRMKNNRF